MSASLQPVPHNPFGPEKALLDKIELRHGPIPLLGRLLLLANQAVNDRGVQLQLHSELNSLAEHYPSVIPDHPVPVLSLYDPAHSDLSPENSFWISGHDDAGRIVTTQAVRFYDMSETTVERELTSMRFFYADPEKHAAAGESIVVDCPPAKTITGRVVMAGSIAVHPDFRKSGFGRILPRINRAIALSMWNPDYIITIVETKLTAKNMHAVYGYTRHSPLIKLHDVGKRTIEVELLWMTRDEVLEDLRLYMSELMTSEVRTTDTTDTNLVSPRLQGSSNRS